MSWPASWASQEQPVRTQRGITSGSISQALVILALLFGTAPMHAQPSPPSRPILFVPGWCGDAFQWAPFFDPNNQYGLAALLPASMYPKPQDVYLVEYNRWNNQIGFYKEGKPELGANSPITPVGVAVPSTARFFVISFIDSDPTSTGPNDPVNVAASSILNKAYEISVVVKYINQLTGSQQVNILAHSMGGLDARAYVENMASLGDCFDYTNSVPNYSAASCSPGTGLASYGNDVANIITLDTPNNGSSLTLNGWRYLADRKIVV